MFGALLHDLRVSADTVMGPGSVRVCALLVLGLFCLLLMYL